MNRDLSVVMAVYDAVDPCHLDDAMKSLASQTRLADEVVLVADGPLTAGLDAVIDRWSDLLPLRRVDLDRHRGSGPAKQAGVVAATGDLVAIADADDICHETRFERQTAEFLRGDIDILGSAMVEFDASTGEVLGVRAMPGDGGSIARLMKRSNPINHPTVMFRRGVILDSGGYANLPLLEDYDLWARAMSRGAELRNLDDALVSFRGGPSAQSRRRGLTALRSELRLQRRLREYGVIGTGRAVVNWAARCMYRWLPPSWGFWFYRRMFVSRATNGRSERPEYDHHVDMSEVRGPLADAFARQILETTGLSGDEARELRVLDVGAGYGDTARALARHCLHVTCLEPAQALHNRSQEQARGEAVPNMDFIHGGVEDLDAIEQYDLVVLDNVYEHLPNHGNALTTLWTALRPGGRLYLLTPNKLWPIEAHYGLPGLAWLPVPIANLYLRVSRRGRDYQDASYAPTYWGLRKTLDAHGSWDYEFTLPGDPSATVAGTPWHYRLGMAAIDRFPALWAISKALLVVAIKRPSS